MLIVFGLFTGNIIQLSELYRSHNTEVLFYGEFFQNALINNCLRYNPNGAVNEEIINSPIRINEKYLRELVSYIMQCF